MVLLLNLIGMVVVCGRCGGSPRWSGVAVAGTMVNMSAFQDLRRSTADRKLTGLCGGVAQQWRIDPLLVRIFAVLLVLSGGLGLVLYAFGWLTVPEEGKTESAAHRLIPPSRTWPREAWIAILVVAGVVCLSLLGQLLPLGLMPAVIIVAVWYFGFRKPGAASTPDTPRALNDPLAGPSTPFTDAARAWQQRMSEYQQIVYRQTGTPWDHPPTPPEELRQPVTRPWPTQPTHPTAGPSTSAYAASPNPQVGPTSDGFYAHPDPAGLYTSTPATSSAPTGDPDPYAPSPAVTTRAATTTVTRRVGATPAARRLRLAVLVVAGLALAGLGLADVLGAPITAVTYLATALLVVGLGLVVACWVGRARGLLPIGLVLAIATVATYAGVTTWHQYGDQLADQQISYSQIADLPARDSWDVGTYRIDLSGLSVDDDRTYQVSLDVGQLDLVLPADQRVRVEASTDAGTITMPGVALNGPDLAADRTYGPATGPVLTVKVHVDAGSIQVSS